MKPSNPLPQPSDWDHVADWYDHQLQDEGQTHHRKVIIPGVLKLLGCTAGQRVLDIACGQGVVCRAIAEAGANIVGVDASENLIALARRRCRYPDRELYLRGDARTLGEMPALLPGSFDSAVCILAIQNMTPLSPVWQGCRRLLKAGGHLLVVMVHPCFRVPRQSSWQWDQQDAAQYRRIDTYLTSEKVPIVMHPGKRPDVTTLTFHRPLQAYVNTLSSAGLLVDHMDEWISHKSPPAGKRFTALDRSRREIPLFLALRSRAV
jgi:ubiquinone/menaquinone biosynthesis C-methylase UbiE